MIECKICSKQFKRFDNGHTVKSHHMTNNDTIKNKIAKDNGYELIRIRLSKKYL